MTKFAVRRPNFVDGMLLIAEDLSLEQSYFDRRLRQLAARAGWDIVEGLDVTVDAQKKLTISPGYAIDQQGNEVVVDESPRESVVAREGVLCICRGDPMPLTASDVARMACISSNAGVVVRTIEQAKVEIRQWSGVKDLQEGWVPIARIFTKPDVASIPVRRLTTISEISWTHGESGAPADWWMRFSAPVPKVPANALEVRVRSADGAETITAPTMVPDDNKTLHKFKVELAPRKNVQQKGRTVFIRLACDFVLDWKGDPVSGAHLRGEVPTDKGVAGGVFESWLTIQEQTL
jgi:hypothetical protein